MDQYVHLKNLLDKWEQKPGNQRKFTAFRKAVGKTFIGATKAGYERDTYLGARLEERTGYWHGEGVAKALENLSGNTRGSPELAIALYLLCKIDPLYQIYASQLDEALFGKGKSLEQILEWSPDAYLGESADAAAAPNSSAPPVLQPTLSPPRLTDERTHYSHHLIRSLGRGEEEATLQRFASLKPGFRWLQLAGAAGQGKSLLADELVREMGDEWAKGILRSDALRDFADHWKQWEPDRPHLMVVDYVIGSEEHIQSLMRGLAGRSFRHPVCILILERQRWDRGGVSASEAIGDPGRAEWFAKVNKSKDGDNLAHESFRFESGVIELRNLEPSDLTSIVHKFAALKGVKLVESDEFIQGNLARIDRQGRPLFAYFLAQSLMDGTFKAGWSDTDLLTSVLNRDLEKRWSHAFKTSPPNLTDDQPALRLALLATMIRSLDSTKLGDEFGSRSNRKDDLHRALIMVDGPIEAGIGGPGTNVPGLEPDLLGEWFVLYALEHTNLVEPLARAAWEVAPSEMMAFLVRLTADFPKHPSTRALLEFEPAGVAARRYSAIAAIAVASQLFQVEVSIPPQTVRALRRALKGGFPLAAFFLGVRHYAGIGAKRSKVRAAGWFLRGALAGQVLCIVGLGRCLSDLLFFFIPWRLAIAAYCFRKGSEKGNEIAMNLLATFYLHGAGVRKSPEKAVAWLEKSAGLGNGQAMKTLGQLYYDGDGVAQNYDQAFFWFEKGSLTGDGAAMNGLAICFATGHGVKPDMRKAIDWWRKAAVEGNGDAMVRLGRLHLHGVAVDGKTILEKDIGKTKELFAKGTETHAIWDTDELASLRALGFIPLPEDEIKELRQLTYVPLANDRTTNKFLNHLSWRFLSVEEAGPYLTRIERAAVAMRRRFLATKAILRDVRVSALEFYEGYELVHLSLTDTYNKRWWSCGAVVGPDGAIILDGKAQRIRTLNSFGLFLNSVEAHEAYLRFFAEFLWGRSGAFHIVDHVEQLEFYPWVPIRRREAIGATIQRLSCLQNHKDGRAGLTFAATVLHGSSLSNCTFEVLRSGDVEMLDDNPCPLFMVVKGDQYAGPLRSSMRI